jgi:prolyl-tRNA synthetase
MRVKDLLEEMQKGLYDRALAFREENTADVSSMDEMKEFFRGDSKGGFARAYFAGSADDEGEVKSLTGGATIRCMPLEDESRGRCVYTGKDGAPRAIFAKAY